MERKEIRKSQGGFTLIEIIAVIVLLGVLAAVIVPQFNNITDEARDASARQAVAEGVARFNASVATLILTSANAAVPAASAVVTDVCGTGNDSFVTGEYTVTYDDDTVPGDCTNGGVTISAIITGSDGTPATGGVCLPAP